MKRLAIIFLLLVLCIFIVASIYYFWSDIRPEPPPITPIAYLPELILTPAPIPTAEPGVRVIPLPPRIITVEIIREFVPVDNPAKLEIVNDWTSLFTVNFQGIQIAIAPGESETREIPPGEYVYTIITDCGQQTDTITLEANTVYTLKLFCSTTGPFGGLPGTDWSTLIVDNQTDQIITFSIDGRGYQVPPGLTDIQLPPGSYTYNVSLPGIQSPPPESVTLSAGDYVTATFSISTGP